MRNRCVRAVLWQGLTGESSDGQEQFAENQDDEFHKLTQSSEVETKVLLSWVIPHHPVAAILGSLPLSGTTNENSSSVTIFSQANENTRNAKFIVGQESHELPRRLRGTVHGGAGAGIDFEYGGTGKSPPGGKRS